MTDQSNANEARRLELVAQIRAVLVIPFANRSENQHASVGAARAELAQMVGRPATVPLTIDGTTRDVEVRWWRDDRGDTPVVALARIARGGKLWPTALSVFVNDEGRVHVSMTVSIPGQRKHGAVVHWATGDDRIKPKYLSASIHAAGEAGRATRAKAHATRTAMCLDPHEADPFEGEPR